MTRRSTLGLAFAAVCVTVAPIHLARADDPAPAKALTPRQIYQRMGPAVVLIIASDDQKTGSSLGTGSVISSDGLVLTNNHVIFNDDAKRPFKECHVFLKPQRVTGESKNDLQHHFVAKVLKNDPNLDLALLKIDDVKDLPKLEFGNSDDLIPGDTVIAIGHPEGGGFWTLTTGAIGGMANNYRGTKGKDVFQMETSLNRGNSGGPLIDARGYQVGVNSFIVRQGEGGLAITGVNFALRSSAVKKWLEDSAAVQVAYGTAPVPGADGADTAVAANVPPPSKAGTAEPPPDVPEDTASKANVSRKGKARPADPPPPPPTAGTKPAADPKTGKSTNVGYRRAPVKMVDDRSAEERKPRKYDRTKFLTGFGSTLAGIRGAADAAQSDMDKKMDAFRKRRKK